jgi:hypothetical protein
MNERTHLLCRHFDQTLDVHTLKVEDQLDQLDLLQRTHVFLHGRTHIGLLFGSQSPEIKNLELIQKTSSQTFSTRYFPYANG